MNPTAVFIEENQRAAKRFSRMAQEAPGPITVVHHNDADGIAAAAILSFALERLNRKIELLPIEKVHGIIIERIHNSARGLILYADLGGQSSDLIGRCIRKDQNVIILDHHLPGKGGPSNVIHLNPELCGISGDDDAAGAAVCALFAGALLRNASLFSSQEEAWLAALGVVGAIGDRQQHEGLLTGINAILLKTAMHGKAIEPSMHGWLVPRLGNRSIQDVVEMLNLLGSVGFYAGSAAVAVQFLLGTDAGKAHHECGRLRRRMTDCFRIETMKIHVEGIESSEHFQWVNVKDRFVPMGVKAIGLFLEYLIEQNRICRHKYLIGFQHLPLVMPGIGRLERSFAKVSARVHGELKDSIQQGKLPDFMTLIPKASAMVDGTADGCHRFKAASLIEQGLESAFLQALEHVFSHTQKCFPR